MGLITSWSISRLDKYQTCPRRAKYEILDKMCPECFEGRLFGGFGKPVQCDTCGKTIEDPAPIARGSEIGANLDGYVTGKNYKLHKEIRHPIVKKLAKIFRSEHKRGLCKSEFDIVLDKDWKPTSKFDKKAWFRGKLDILQFNKLKIKVYDWKTGGIDKRTGAVRAQEKYTGQLAIYRLTALCQFPHMEEADSSLIFTDAGPVHDCEIPSAHPTLRKDMERQQRRWEGEVKAMLSDEVFKPTPNEGCKWCPFSKSKGGPCPN